MTTAAEVLASPLPPAPGAREHVALDLVDSAFDVPADGTVELLPTPRSATRWLVGRGLAPADADLQDYCLGRLTGLRGHLREVVAACVAGREPSPASVAALNDALTRTPTAHLLRWNPTDGLHAAPDHPTTRVVEHALARIAEDAVALVTGPESGLLAACEAAPCTRFFLRTHGRRRWCSTRCGDRVRAARAYARRRGDTPG